MCRLGQYKVYFNRSQINSTAAMQFAARALAMDAFTANGLNRRDVGITIMNDEEVYPVNYYFGVFNGAGPLVNRFAQFSSEEADGRAVRADKLAEILFPLRRDARRISAISMQISAAISINSCMRRDSSGISWAGRDMAKAIWPIPRLLKWWSGEAMPIIPGLIPARTISFVGIDLANLNLSRDRGPAMETGEFLDRGLWTSPHGRWIMSSNIGGFRCKRSIGSENIDRHDKGLPCLQTAVQGGPCTAFAPGQFGNATGWYVQSGYYLIPRKLEVAARYAYWDPDTRIQPVI